MTWRDGVHLTGSPIWCDARRRRDVCFVSSADRVGRTGHGQLIGSPITLALLGARGEGHLAVPLRRRFTLGTLRLELISSGRGLGGAALHVDLAGRTVLYAGAVRTSAGGLAEPAEVRACDALVVAAPAVAAELPTVDAAADRLATWARTQLAAGAVPVVVADVAVEALEIAARLVAAGITVAATRVVREAAARIGELATLPPMSTIRREPAAVLAIDGERVKLPGEQVATTLRVSVRPLADGALAWPFVATPAQLLAWIEQARARAVFVTGDGADAIVAALGARARVLGPPRQMALFAP